MFDFFKENYLTFYFNHSCLFTLLVSVTKVIIFYKTSFLVHCNLEKLENVRQT